MTESTASKLEVEKSRRVTLNDDIFGGSTGARMWRIGKEGQVSRGHTEGLEVFD